jgi:hypothetical protein
MKSFVAPLAFVAMAISACAPPLVTPMSADLRKAVTSVGADVSGVRHSDTSQLGARGSKEGADKGAAAAASHVLRSGGSLLGMLIVAPLAAVAGAAAGSSNARSEDVVDAARLGLRQALQEEDFTAILRTKMTAIGVTSNVTMVTVAQAGPVPANISGSRHVLTLEYQMGLLRDGVVVPKVGIIAQVKGQMLSPDRSQVLHTNTWFYCGPVRDFVEMSRDRGALLRVEIDKAAAVLAEAIHYDLFVSSTKRFAKPLPECMDLSDLPGTIVRTNTAPGITPPSDPIRQPMPVIPNPHAAPVVAPQPSPANPPAPAIPNPYAVPVAAPQSGPVNPPAPASPNKETPPKPSADCEPARIGFPRTSLLSNQPPPCAKAGPS